MNAFATFLGFLIVVANLSAQLSPPEVRLVGTAADGSQQMAIVEFKKGTKNEVALFHEHERIQDFEIIAIDAAHGTVQALFETQKNPQTFNIPMPDGVTKAPKLNLCNVDVTTALAVLGQVCHLTVLAREEDSPSRTNYFAAPDADEKVVFNVLTNGLAEFGISIIRDAEPFVFAIPTPLAGTFSFALAPKTERKSGVVSVVPAGMLRWVRADILQVCEFYGDLSDRSLVLTSPQCRPTHISVLNVTPITRAQAVWMLESLFQLNRIAVIPAKTNITIVAPFSQTNELPVFAMEQTGADAMAFPSIPKLQAASARQLLELYCDLTKGTAGSAAVPGSFQIMARKTIARGEAKFALEAAAALQGLTFQANSEGKTDLIVGRRSKSPD